MDCSFKLYCLTLLGTGAINGTGNALANVITGTTGANTLAGAGGADTLVGRAGNDTYDVDDPGDVVVENAAEGTDTVQSSVSYTLAENVENLTLTGSGAISGTGNALENVMTGNGAANVLAGGAGNDTYIVTGGNVSIVENPGEGTDTVQSQVTWTLSAELENLTLTGGLAIDGTGNAANNLITGNSATNTLTGGAGDDTYVVQNTNDLIVELAGEGTDLVSSSVSFTLSQNVENLTLTDSAVSGTGNGLDNILVGNSVANTLNGGAGNDRLDGGGGNDTMSGGTGDDVYVVSQSMDSCIENPGEGLDRIETSVTLTSAMAANIEILFQTAGSNINATGNSLNNLMRGNAGNNTLSGGAGVDLLEGGSGNDTLNDSGGNTLLNGGAGTDALTGTANNDLLIGGAGSDTLTTGSGADVIVFNRNDGLDTVASSTTKDHTLSIGGGALYSDLTFQKTGNNLILHVGASDQITFTNYYAATANRSVNTLQMIIEGTTDYDANSSDVTRNRKIESFSFDGLVSAFDAALVANPGLTSWALTSALAAQYLSGSDTAAIGGDLAYRYGRFGTLSDISFTPALGILSAAGFGTSAQTLQSLASLQDTSPRLS